MDRTVRVGNAGGYWGDDLGALARQVEGGDLDYVGLDFLAEITMSIMQKLRQRDPAGGYATDFVDQMRTVWREASRKGTRILTNAGGVNPRGLGEKLVALAKQQGIDARVGVVTGDDLMHRLDELAPYLSNMETGEGFERIRGRVAAANAYFGAGPLAAALEGGADVVVTGRCTDTALVMAPLIHAFKWDLSDWDKLAAGLVGGHILECGTQSTGGNFSDWRTVPDMVNLGYPVLEGRPDGSFTITKHAGTGGLVSVGTVSEQLVYEMGDPSTYITPDVTADFRTIRLAADGVNRVAVTGIRGRPPPDKLKVSLAYRDGFKGVGELLICGPDALAKAERFAELFWARLPFRFESHRAEYVGHSSCHGALAPATETNEVLLRLAVRDPDQKKVAEFGKLLPSMVLSGPPGVTITGGRPKPQEILAYWPALIPRDSVSMQVEVQATSGEPPRVFPVPVPPAPGPGAAPRLPTRKVPKPARPERVREVPLHAIAHGRSGDKGDTCNIGIVARSEMAYGWLRGWLTAARVKRWMSGLVLGKVTRHEVDNLLALNFLCEQSLDGGGTQSLRADAQGKTFSWAVLAQKVEAPVEVIESCVPKAPAKKASRAAPSRSKRSPTPRRRR